MTAHLPRGGHCCFCDDPPRAFSDVLTVEIARVQEDDPVPEFEAHDVAELRLGEPVNSTSQFRNKTTHCVFWRA